VQQLWWWLRKLLPQELLPSQLLERSVLVPSLLPSGLWLVRRLQQLCGCSELRLCGSELCRPQLCGCSLVLLGRCHDCRSG